MREFGTELNGVAMSFKQFGWVEDGIYDYQHFLVRYNVVDGNATIVLSKMWVDSGVPEELDAKYKLPWGSYPDMPPKPPKK
jgi:hypothetical protein